MHEIARTARHDVSDSFGPPHGAAVKREKNGKKNVPREACTYVSRMQRADTGLLARNCAGGGFFFVCGVRLCVQSCRSGCGHIGLRVAGGLPCLSSRLTRPSSLPVSRASDRRHVDHHSSKRYRQPDDYSTTRVGWPRCARGFFKFINKIKAIGQQS